MFRTIGSPDGVGMFFVMSGMLVYRSGERAVQATGHWREYARNRFLRIAPAIYWYTAVVTALLVAIGAMEPRAILTGGYAVWVAGSLVLLPNYDPAAFDQFGTGILNGPLWSIPAEVSFYIAVPFLYLIAKRIGFNKMLLLLVPVAILAPLGAHLAGGGIENAIHHSFAQELAYFGIGVFWSHYWVRAPQKVWLFVVAIVAWCTLIPVVGSEWYRPVILALPLSYSVIYIGYHGPAILSRITHHIGDISFGTYIWHMPIINFFVWKGWVDGWWTVPSVLLLAWAFGATSWWMVERRWMLHKRFSTRYLDTGERVA